MHRQMLFALELVFVAPLCIVFRFLSKNESWIPDPATYARRLGAKTRTVNGSRGSKPTRGSKAGPAKGSEQPPPSREQGMKSDEHTSGQDPGTRVPRAFRLVFEPRAKNLTESLPEGWQRAAGVNRTTPPQEINEIFEGV
jgi:hypothetical protein